MQQKFLEKTLGQQIADMAAKYPDDNMIDYTDRDYSRTWKEFNDECETIARGFMALGLKKGSHISIWGTNVPAWLLTFFGSAKMGGILVTVNTSYKVFELDYQLKQSDSEAIVLIDGYKGTSYIDIINELCPELESCEPGKLKSRRLPLLKSVIYAGEGECPAGMVDWKDLYTLAEQTPVEEFEAVRDSCDCHEVVNIQYTSGTTGFPKGVMLTHYNILNNGQTIGDGMKFTHDDRLCITVPFFHCENSRMNLTIDAVRFVIPVHNAALRFLRHSVFFQRRRDLRFIPAQFFSLQCNAIFVEVSVFVRFIKIGGQRHIELQRFQLGRQHCEAVLAGNNRQRPSVVPLHMELSCVVDVIQFSRRSGLHRRIRVLHGVQPDACARRILLPQKGQHLPIYIHHYSPPIVCV